MNKLKNHELSGNEGFSSNKKPLGAADYHEILMIILAVIMLVVSAVEVYLRWRASGFDSVATRTLVFLALGVFCSYFYTKQHLKMKVWRAQNTNVDAI